MIKVYSKIKLSDDLRKKVLKIINEMNPTLQFKMDDLKFEIDKNIISGIRIDKYSEILDLTLNNRLDKILTLLK
jgi:F0F1-type ATP synthase delta subunit